MASPAELFRSLLGHHPVALAQNLLNLSDLGDALESQEVGAHQPSMTSTATVIYSLGSIDCIPDSIVDRHLNLIYSWVEEDGQVRDRFPADEASGNLWRSSQMLLALLSRPNLLPSIDRAKALAGRIIKQQDASGGFSYRPRAGQCNALFTLYPVLALRRAVLLGVLDGDEVELALRNAGNYLLRILASRNESCAMRILACAGYQQLSPVNTVADSTLQQISNQFSKVSSNGEIVTDHKQPLFYVRLHRPSLLLAARKVRQRHGRRWNNLWARSKLESRA